MEDADIVELYWAREQRALTATYEKYYSYCRRIALNVLRSEEDAEECVNDVWYSVWESIPPARPELLSAYLAKITRNLALKKLRDDATLRENAKADVRLDLCTPYYARVTVAAFQSTHTSATEKAVLWRLDHEERMKRERDRLIQLEQALSRDPREAQHDRPEGQKGQ